jgi:hypothetical protein
MVKTGAWISEAWALLKEDFWWHVLVALIFTALNSTGVGFLLIGPLTCSYEYIIMQKLRNRPAPLNINDLSKGIEVWLEAFLASLVVGLFSSVGAFACGVGAIIVSALLVFVMPLVIDRRMGFWDAIVASWEKTKAHWFEFSLFWFLLMLLAGAIVLFTLGLGALVTLPLVQIVIVLAYRDNFGLMEE